MIQQTEALLGMAGCIQSLMIDGMGSRLKYDLEFSTSEDVIQVENIGECLYLQNVSIFYFFTWPFY